MGSSAGERPDRRRLASRRAARRRRRRCSGPSPCWPHGVGCGSSSEQRSPAPARRRARGRSARAGHPHGSGLGPGDRPGHRHGRARRDRRPSTVAAARQRFRAGRRAGDRAGAARAGRRARPALDHPGAGGRPRAAPMRGRACCPSQHLRADVRLAPARPGDSAAALLVARGPPDASRSAEPTRSASPGACAPGCEAPSRRSRSPSADLLPGLVVGDTAGMPPDVVTDFRTSGLTHLVAVSGANVAIVLAAALLAARWGGLRAQSRTRRWVCSPCSASSSWPAPSRRSCARRCAASSRSSPSVAAAGRRGCRRCAPPSWSCSSSTPGSGGRTASRCPSSPRLACWCSPRPGASGSRSTCRRWSLTRSRSRPRRRSPAPRSS